MKDTRDQYIIGVTLSPASSFQAYWVKAEIPLSLTLGVNDTRIPSVECCHLFSYREMEGSAAVMREGSLAYSTNLILMMKNKSYQF